MPVTARLSKAFYEKLGEQVTSELVAWFNDVDATYRTDLREINELNFARFDAKLEQRFAQQDAKLEQRFAQQDAKFDQRMGALERRMSSLETTLERRLGEQTRFFFVAWASLLIPVIGLWFRR